MTVVDSVRSLFGWVMLLDGRAEFLTAIAPL
jgi:hypothetical protein